MKVSIIGAGNVGATLAMRIVENGIADVVMVDIRGNTAKGKSLDISDAASIMHHESKLCGTDDISSIKGSSVVVITAGFPRKPGMKREELLSKNKAIVTEASAAVKKHAKDSIVIVVTNPLDIMTYVAHKVCGFPKNRVLGMAGGLDASRFIELVSEKLKVKRSSISTMVMGSHGDTMVPVISQTKISDKPITQILKNDEIEKIVQATKTRGAEIVSLLGQGSAYYAPSAAVLDLIESISHDKKTIHCVSAFLKGEYGLKGIYIGVPAKIGKDGVEEILEIELSPEEQESFKRSADTIKKNLASIKS